MSASATDFDFTGPNPVELTGTFEIDQNEFVGTTVTNNQGDGLLTALLRSNANAQWDNLDGASLEITDNAGFEKWTAQGILNNNTGASLLKTGSGNSLITYWDLANNGFIDVQEGTLAISSSSLSGTGTIQIATASRLTFDGSIDAAGATQTLSGGGIFGLDLNTIAGGTLTLGGTYILEGVGIRLISGAVVNTGTATFQTNTLRSAQSASWTNHNGASLTLADDAGFEKWTAQGTLQNDVGASLLKTGPGTSSITSWDLANNGLIDVQEGTLAISNSSLSGTGTIQIATASRLTFDGSIDAAGATQTLSGGGIFGLDLNTIAGGTLTLGGTYILEGVSGRLISGAVVNTGTATLQTNALRSAQSASWTNQSGASLTLADNAGFEKWTTQGTLQNDAGATLAKSGPGTSTITSWDLANNGFIDVQEGTLAISSSSLSGTGTFQIATASRLTFDGSIDAAGATQTLSGGGIFGLDLNTIAGGTLTLGGTYTIEGVSGRLISGAVVNTGTATLQTNALRSAQSASWTNQSGASLTLADDAGFEKWTTQGTLQNDVGASLLKTGPGTSSITSWDLANNGFIDVQEGTLAISSSSLSGTGTFQIATASRLTFDGSIDAAGATQTLSGGGIFGLDLNTIASGTLTLGGTYTIEGVSGRLISGAVVNTGTATLQTNALRSAQSASWTNQSGASLTLTDNAGFEKWTTQGTLQNDTGATLAKSGSGNSSITSWDLANNGLLHVRNGTLRHSNGLIGGHGEFRIAAGAELETNALLHLSSGARLTGNGLFDGDLAVSTGGIIAPGASPGQLSVEGTVDFLGGGILALDLAQDPSLGLAGVDWDQLQITGELDLSALLVTDPFILDLTLDAASITTGILTTGSTWSNIINASAGIVAFDPAVFAFQTSDPRLQGITGEFTLAQVGNQIDLIYTGLDLILIPEPGALTLLLSLLLGTIGITRRRP